MHNTSLVPLFLAGTVLIIVLFLAIVTGIQLYLKKQKSSIAEKAEMLHAHQQQLMEARLEEQERVMTQVSRDLHDNLSQQIGFLQMNLKGMAESVSNPELQGNYIENCKTITGRLSNDMRNISYSLNSDYIRARGLGEVLEKEVRFINNARGHACELEVEGVYATLPSNTELIIYRIAQEALHNVLKHAHAGRIWIRLCYDEHFMHLYVSDDGGGFDTSSSQFRSGLGIYNMQQRALLLNAQLRIESSLGGGCSLMLKVPRTASRLD